MEITVPVFNQTIPRGNGADPVYRCRPLFGHPLHAEDMILARATRRLGELLRRAMSSSGRTWDHSMLLSWGFSPAIQTRRFKLNLELRKQMLRVVAFTVTFPVLGRQAGFFPALPGTPWFDLDNGNDLETRTVQVLTEHFRKLEKEDDEAEIKSATSSSTLECWVSWLDLNVRTDPVDQNEAEKKLLSLFGIGDMDGAAELARTGTRLDDLYPEELQRAILRDRQAVELVRLLDGSDRRPVMLVGPPMVGKTALVHDCVFRRCLARVKPGSQKNSVWWLSPQRLISGMKYVGQWENRLLAILRESNKQDHVLFFDEVMSMFRAGQSRDSRLSVADLLKNAMQARQVRVLAEMTADAWQTLTTHDRGMADMFHVMRLEPTDRAETIRIALPVMRDLELRHRCVFSTNVLPEVMRLQQTYARELAFPGKAIDFLRGLAIKKGGAGPIQRHSVLQEFQNRTGLLYALLDDSQAHAEDQVRAELSARIVGQKRAIGVCARVVGMARARMNEWNRPLATLLFTGPTGVGKTQCAKALSEVMFGSRQPLVRLDLNQFKSAYSATTLVGTSENPEGLLTSAVRQQPFSIVLLDEIEKAHPDVFDLLLQVMGEGRLTDSLGRTTDFSGCVIVMTSNLGSTHNRQPPGFGQRNEEHHFVSAARQFFRPEFFNRIDEIIPFERLSRAEIAEIAQGLLAEVMSREGLVRRRCILVTDDDALDSVVEAGFHPELGARAMKRALEDHFARPVARRLASLSPEEPTLVRVSRAESGLETRVVSLVEAEPLRPAKWPDDPGPIVAATRSFLARVRSAELSSRPPGEIVAGKISAAMLKWLAISEQARCLEDALVSFESRLGQRQKNSGSAFQSPGASTPRSVADYRGGKRMLKDFLSAEDIRSYLQENQMDAERGTDPRDVTAIVDHAALLNSMLEPAATETVDRRTYSDSTAGNHGIESDQVLVGFVSMDDTPAENLALHFGMGLAFDNLQRSLSEDFGFEAQPLKAKTGRVETETGQRVFVMAVQGPFVRPVVDALEGCYLFTQATGKISLLRCVVLDGMVNRNLKNVSFGLGDPDELARRVDRRMAETELERLSVLQVRRHGQAVFDVRLRRLDPAADGTPFLRSFVMGGLDLPDEIANVLKPGGESHAHS